MMQTTSMQVATVMQIHLICSEHLKIFTGPQARQKSPCW